MDDINETILVTLVQYFISNLTDSRYISFCAKCLLFTDMIGNISEGVTEIVYQTESFSPSVYAFGIEL